MRLRSGDDRRTDLFPAHCQVRGCESPPQEWFEIEQHSFEVCHAHGLQLRAGEAFTTTDAEILAGLDSASELINVRRLRTATGTVYTLEIGHHGVIEDEVPVKVTPQQRAALASLLGDEAEDGA
jgi:hypothetical protein